MPRDPPDPPGPAPAAPPTETAPHHEAGQERLDDEGLPLDRPATLDDVRSAEGSGRTVAVGCTVLVVVAVAAFWALRVLILH